MLRSEWRRVWEKECMLLNSTDLHLNPGYVLGANLTSPSCGFTTYKIRFFFPPHRDTKWNVCPGKILVHNGYFRVFFSAFSDKLLITFFIIKTIDYGDLGSILRNGQRESEAPTLSALVSQEEEACIYERPCSVTWKLLLIPKNVVGKGRVRGFVSLPDIFQSSKSGELRHLPCRQWSPDFEAIPSTLSLLSCINPQVKPRKGRTVGGQTCQMCPDLSKRPLWSALQQLFWTHQRPLGSTLGIAFWDPAFSCCLGHCSLRQASHDESWCSFSPSVTHN